MLKRVLPTLVALLVLPAVCLAEDALYAAFQDPPSAARPFVRWWWNGGCVTEPEILRELDVMKEAGIGGVEINTIQMPQPSIPGSLHDVECLEWLSPEWNAVVKATTEGTRARDMTADVIVGSGWPFGGRFLEGSDRTQRVRVVVVPLPEAGVFEASLEDLAERKERRRDEVAVEPRLVFLRLVPDGLTRFEPGEELSGVPGIVGEDGTIRLETTGAQKLYVGIHEEGYTFVKRGAPGADGPVLNHFDAGAVRRYLDRMSDALGPALGGELGDALRAAFVDSLELDFANWTGDLPAEFERRRGYPLAPYLPFVLDVGGEGEGTPFADTVRRARYDFHRTVVELFQERFLGTYTEWCHDNGVLSRTQAYGRETHPIDGGLLIDIPEGESWLWGDHDRITKRPTVVNRYVSSAARLAGKRLTSHEAMTNAVPAFRATLADLKLLLDKSLLTGVLHPILHGFNYSPLDAGFPGWVQFGTWFNEKNTWWPHVRRFMDYSARLTAVLTRSDGQASLAILGPRADEWARYVRLYQPFPEVAVPWYHYALPDALASAGYGSDFVSEKVLQESSAADGRLRYGPREWKGLLVLDAESVEPDTARAIERFARAGGRVVFVGRAPHRAPGLLAAEVRDREVRQAIEAARATDAARVAVVPAPVGGPLGDLDQTRRDLPAFARRELLHWATTTLPGFGLEPAVRIDAPHVDVAQLRHRLGERDIVFFANTSETETVAFRARVAGAGPHPWRWDAETGARAPYPTEETGALWIRLEPSESLLLVFEPDDTERPDAEPVTLRPSTPPVEWKILNGPWQATFRHVVDDRTFERELRPLEDLSLSDDPELATFAGTVTYRTTFEIEDVGFDRLDLGRANGTTRVTLNGEPLGVSWWGRHLFDVGGVLRKGVNTLEVEVTTVAANYIHSLEDNPAAHRWTWWYPPISTGLVGPVRLLKTQE
jgi:hypothetical protein